MQIIEVSATGVRSAVITLQSAATPMRIVLFPMIHLGTPDFYQSVTARLRHCRVLVAEGVAGRSIASLTLALAYRLPARSRRLALTIQQIDYASLGIPVIWPDMTAKQLRKGWRSVPSAQRIAVWCLAPPFALALWLLGTRRVIARHLGSKDDLPTHQEDHARQVTRELTELILDHRDALLMHCLASIHEARQTEKIDVAVVYGADHMPAIAHELLRRYGYRPRTAEWLTVFDY